MLKLKFLLITVNLVLFSLQFWLTSIHSVSGREMADATSQLSAIKSQNLQLRQFIWQQSSLALVQQRAENLKLVSIPASILDPLSTAMVP